MKELIDKIQEHKELWFIVPILMYVISFVLEYTYYQSFDLNITPYISPLGLIFSFASLFIGFLIISCIHIVSGLMIKFTFYKSKWRDKSLKNFMLPGIFILYIIQRYAELAILTREIIWNYIIIFMGTFILLFLEQIRHNFSLRLGMIFVILCAFVINFNYSRILYNTFGGLNSLSFNYNGNYIHSNSTDRIFIGETSDFLFLYDKYKKATTVYKKANIDSLVIQPRFIKIVEGKIVSNHTVEKGDNK